MTELHICTNIKENNNSYMLKESDCIRQMGRCDKIVIK